MKKNVTFKFDLESIAKLKELAKLEKRSQAVILEILIDKEYNKL